MKHTVKVFLGLLVTALFSCEDDPTNVDPQNSAPGNFSVNVSDITETTALITWTAPDDPDGDNLTYDVILNDNSVSENQSDLSFQFDQLLANTAYTGSVIAKDGNQGESTASFSFFTTGAGMGGNSNPGAFTVSISDITHNSAKLTWTDAIDSNGDPVTYSVELGSVVLVSSQSETSYDLSGLASGEELSGRIIAEDGNGGTSESTFELTSYVIDISKYMSMPGFVSATLIDCEYAEGGSGKCYEIKFSSNPVDDEGPFCPQSLEETGGFGNYNGDGLDNGSATNGDPVGFSIMNAALFLAMENDGYDIIDEQGQIRISDFSGMDNPSFGYCLEPLPDDNLTLTFQVPIVPELLSSPDNIETVEYIGLALDGVPINGYPPTVAGSGAMGEGKIPSLDRCGGHHDPAGYYHWHFLAAHMNETLDAQGLLDEDNGIECTKKDQSPTAMVGYARDGYPIYSGQDVEGVDIADLDACNGHTAATSDYPDGIYHYHASTDITNVPPCITGKQSVKSFDKPS